jgi:anion-transporting  ArsA/GET3 family ATPase
MNHLAIDELLDDPALRIIVCCGAGGVGKTTTSAALALRAAQRGRRVVVLTIDPARRLAQSMGLAELDNEPRRVGEDTARGGTLYAMTLDMKRTFDEIVEQHADPERAAVILANPIYRSLSSSFAGTQEYMAMEKLAQLSSRIDEDEAPWDLIVVDTPPSRSALDFLDAPERIGSFLDGPLIRLLANPARRTGRAGLRAFGAGIGLVSAVLDKILGAQLLSEAQTFITSLDAVFGNFRERADATYRMLKADGTAFIVVSAPERDPLREASYFIDRLERDDMPLAGIVLNRVHQPLTDELSPERAATASERLNDTPASRRSVVDEVTSDLLDVHQDLARRYARERRMIASFTAASPTVPRVEVPALADDVHDLDGLERIGDLLARDTRGV